MQTVRRRRRRRGGRRRSSEVKVKENKDKAESNTDTGPMVMVGPKTFFKSNE